MLAQVPVTTRRLTSIASNVLWFALLGFAISQPELLSVQGDPAVLEVATSIEVAAIVVVKVATSIDVAVVVVGSAGPCRGIGIR